MRQFALLLGVVALALWGGVAAAHSELVAAEPAPGAQLADSPPEIRLTFSEPVAAASQIVVLGENFRQVEGIVPQYNPEQPQVVYTPLPPLAAGVYTVQWTAASADGHEISGSYSFSVGVAGASGTSNPETAATGQQAATSNEISASRNIGWLAAIGLVAVGLPLALLGLRRVDRRGKD